MIFCKHFLWSNILHAIGWKWGSNKKSNWTKIKNTFFTPLGSNYSSPRKPRRRSTRESEEESVVEHEHTENNLETSISTPEYFQPRHSPSRLMLDGLIKYKQRLEGIISITNSFNVNVNHVNETHNVMVCLYKLTILGLVR